MAHIVGTDFNDKVMEILLFWVNLDLNKADELFVETVSNVYGL